MNPFPTDSPGDAGPPVRAMRTGQHLLAGLLLVVGAIRGIAMGDGPVAVVVAALAFTIAYWYPVLLRRPEKLFTRPWLGLVTVVWMGCLWASEEFTWLAFLLWLIAGQVFDLMLASLYSAGVFIAVTVAPILHSGTTTYAAVIGPFIGAIFALAISRSYLRLLQDAAHRRDLLTALREAGTDMAALQDELALTQRHAGVVAERTRLAREIHDTVAQEVSSIRLLTRAALDSGTGFQETLEQVEDLSARTTRDVREIIAALTPRELEDQALPAALKRLAARFEADFEVELHVEEIPALSVEAEGALLRMAQSALSNVRRHSRATRVALTLARAGQSVRLDVRDDGIGFDPSSAHGYGLRFMSERLGALGGGLDVESSPGRGTAISAHAPIVKVVP